MKELQDKFGQYELTMDHLAIPDGELISGDECLTFENGTSFIGDEEQIKSKEGSRILAQEYRLSVFLDKDKIAESDIAVVKDLLESRLQEKLNNYPGYTVVSRLCTTELYTHNIGGKIKEDVVAMFIGNLVKRPKVFTIE